MSREKGDWNPESDLPDPDQSKWQLRLNEEYRQPKIYNETGLEIIDSKIYEYYRVLGYETEIFNFSADGMGMRIAGTDKILDNCQDTFAVELGKDKKIRRFALADGVGCGGVGSQYAAETATAAAMQTMAAKSILTPIDKTEIKKIIQNVVKSVQGNFEINKALAELQATDRRGGIERSDRERIKWLEQNSGATTLLFGEIDTENNLHVSLIGDGGYIVVRAGLTKGGISEFQTTVAPPQIPVDKRFETNLKVLYKKISIESGDLLLACTDGVLKGSFKTLKDVGAEAEKMLRDGKSLREIVCKIVDSAVGKDDITVIAQQF